MSSIQAACDCVYCPARNPVTGGVCRIEYDSAGMERCRCDECDGDCDGTLNGDCDTCYDANSGTCMLCGCCNEIHTSGGTHVDLYKVADSSLDILEAEEKRLAEKTLAEKKMVVEKKTQDGKQRGIKKVYKSVNKGPCLVCGIGMTNLDKDRIRMDHDRLLSGVQVEGLAVDSPPVKHGYVHRHCISGPSRKPINYKSLA